MRHKAWFNLAKKVIASNRRELEMPYKLTYVVTKECHSRCLHCDIWKTKPQNELTLDELEQFARNSPFLSWVDFTGGEPTDRGDFAEIVQIFLRHIPDLIFIHFPTNGINSKKICEAARNIARCRPDKFVVTVSLDGPAADHDKLRGIPGNFSKAIQTYIGLRRIEGLSVYLGMTLYPENINKVGQTLEEVRRAVPGFRPDELHLNLPNVSEHYYENASNPIKVDEEFVRIIEKVMAIRGVPVSPFALLERLYQKQVRRYVETGVCPQDCSALMSSCFLSETGLIYPCSIWDEPVGSIREHGYDLRPIIKSQRSTDLRRQLLAKNCPNCWTPCEAYQTIASNLIESIKGKR